jgi:putative PIN family toxin of toxin-antitoxin system
LIRATLDSNILISAMEFQGIGSRLIGMARAGTIRFDTSDAIPDETIGVLRDKFRWDGYRLHFARIELWNIANCVSPQESLAVADDPDDDRILECAVAAGSDIIITRDNDLLRLREYRGIKIMTPDQFLAPD